MLAQAIALQKGGKASFREKKSDINGESSEHARTGLYSGESGQGGWERI